MSADPTHTLEAALAVARHAAEKAGSHIAKRWDTAIHVDYKGDVDLVSEVDLRAEEIVVDVLSAAFPDDGIVAEEGAPLAPGEARVWYVDPIDGTTNFSHGLPQFCVSIALHDQEGAAVGVIYDPLRRWTFHARRGGGAWLGGRRLRVSSAARLDRALLATGFPYDRRTVDDNNVAEFAHLIRNCQGIRRMGAAALDLAFVAAGWLDGFWESKLEPWDMAAGALLVEEAGGRVTDRRGASSKLAPPTLVATNGRIHDALVAELAEVSS